MQRRVHVEMAPPRFCRYFTWARDRACFCAHSTVNFCAYIARTSEIGHFQVKPMEPLFIDFLRDHVQIFDFRKNRKIRKPRYLRWSPLDTLTFLALVFYEIAFFIDILRARALFQKNHFLWIFIVFFENGHPRDFLGSFWSFRLPFFRFFCRYFACTRSFSGFSKKTRKQILSIILRDHNEITLISGNIVESMS